MQTASVRRRSDGTIDFDSYRREAHVLRTQAMVRVFRRASRLVRSLVGAANFAFDREQDWAPPALPQTNSRR